MGAGASGAGYAGPHLNNGGSAGAADGADPSSSSGSGSGTTSGAGSADSGGTAGSSSPSSTGGSADSSINGGDNDVTVLGTVYGAVHNAFGGSQPPEGEPAVAGNRGYAVGDMPTFGAGGRSGANGGGVNTGNHGGGDSGGGQGAAAGAGGASAEGHTWNGGASAGSDAPLHQPAKTAVLNGHLLTNGARDPARGGGAGSASGAIRN